MVHIDALTVMWNFYLHVKDYCNTIYFNCVSWQHGPILLIRKSEEYVYGIWVYKVLGIWKFNYRVKTKIIVEVWGWISNVTPDLIMDVITYPCRDENKSTLVKRASGVSRVEGMCWWRRWVWVGGGYTGILPFIHRQYMRSHETRM